VYEGLLLGVTGSKGLVHPLSVHWPDASGRFQLRLPASVRGQRLALWEDLGQVFSRGLARPGGLVDLASYPARLLQRLPQDVQRISVP
jgi:hypothetical protein